MQKDQHYHEYHCMATHLLERQNRGGGYIFRQYVPYKAILPRFATLVQFLVTVLHLASISVNYLQFFQLLQVRLTSTSQQ